MTEPGKTSWLRCLNKYKTESEADGKGFLLPYVLLVGHVLCSKSFLDHMPAFIHFSTAVKIWLLLCKKGFRWERHVLHFNRLLLAVLLGQNERKKRKRGRSWERGSNDRSANYRWQMPGAWEQWEQWKTVGILDISLNPQGFRWEH